jgi:hypothetical protein
MSKLPAFALPFVTRSLRGGRGKRYLILSLVLASLTGLIGLWLALGSGRFEQSLRTELGLEVNEFELERATFTVYAHDEWELRDAERQLAAIQDGLTDGPGYYGRTTDLYDWGRTTLYRAAWAPAWGDRNLALQQQARRLIGHAHRDYFDNHAQFNWNDPKEVAALEQVVAREGVPSLALYHSPLGWRDALKLTGFIAGLLLAGLGTVFAPLLVAIAQAQERHENTLMPLTGTALNPRELVLGLASGPVAVIAMFAAPQLLIFAICALLAGEPMIATALLGALLATSGLFVFAAQLLGQLMGHRRTPGIIGMSLMSVAGLAWMIGGGLAAAAEHEAAGFAAVLPHIGLSALLAETFVELPAQFSMVFVATSVWTLGAIVFASLIVTALARTVAGNEGPLLTRAQAGIGAATSIVLVNIALPDSGYDASALRELIGLAMLALPAMMLLMGRVPMSEGTPRMRTVPVATLLLEFGAWALAHVLFAGLVWGFDAQALHPVALGWLAWCVVVLGLISIRLVAVPGKLAASVWTGFCAMSLTVGFGQAFYWGVENGRHRAQDVFALMNVSPVLGLLQVGLTIWIPVSLLLHLRRNLHSVR